MNIEELKAVLHTSGEPVERPTDAQLEQAEVELGAELPSDYKQFIKEFGSGQLAAFLGVYNPVSRAIYGNLIDMAKEDKEGYRISKASFPGVYPYDRYPDPGGLLPWGRTDNGDQLYWLTQGHADVWPTVVLERGFCRHYVFSVGMLDFIGELVTGQDSINGDHVFPSDVPFREGSFRVNDLNIPASLLKW